MTKEQLRRAWRVVRAPAIVAALYLILYLSLASLTEQNGLLSPSGSVSLGVLVVGVAVLLLRLVILFVLPALLAYRLTRRVLR